jgi:hypothetical protein
MGSPRTVRLAGAGLAAVVLLAVVALASRGGLGGAHGGGGRLPSSTLLDYGFTIVFVLYVLAVPVALWAYVVGGREARVRRAASGKRRVPLVVQLVLFGLVLGLVGPLIARHRAHGTLPQLTEPPGLSGRLGRGRKPAETTREPQFRWSVVVVLAAAGAAGAAGAAALVVRRRRAEPTAPELAEELATALDDAIDDVRAETDPRRAVIAAYARMEAILAAHGLPRRAAEAPYEFLARALAAVAASAEHLARLTDLYEEARFSTHAIPPSLRDEALDALAAVRDDLRAAA